MARHRFHFVTAALIGAICSAASAQSVHIDTYVGTNSTPNYSNNVSSGSSINLSVDYQISRICIFTAGGGSSANIGAISISHTGGTSRSSELQVILMDRPANLSFPAQGTDLSPVGTNWAGISFDTGTAPYATVSGSITGDLTGAVSATAIGYVELGTSTSTGTITASGGDIDHVKSQSTGGALSGAISAAGHIRLVEALGAISITGGTGISAAAGIDTIKAGYDDGTPHWKNISSVIDADSDSDVGLDGLLGYVECNDLTGSIHAAEFGQYYPLTPLCMMVHGDFDGAIDVRDAVFSELHVVGGYSSGSTIEIGGTLSDLIYAGGDIPSVIVHGDFSDTGPGTLEGVLYIYSGGRLGSVQIDGTAATYYALNYPRVRFLGAEGVDEVHVGGDLWGIVAGAIADPTVPVGTITVDGSASLYVDASTLGTLDVRGDLFQVDGETISIGEFGSDSLIRVGGTYDIPIDIAVGGPSAAIQGQLIFNANDDSGEWLNTVTTYEFDLAPGNSQPIRAPYYEVTSGDIGGGAAGLVPFHLHGTACLPPDSPDGLCDVDFPKKWWPATFAGNEESTERDTIVLILYGPVFDHDDSYGDPDDPATKPVIVERKSLTLCTPTPCSGQRVDWTDDTDMFDVYVPGASHPREVWVSRVLDGNNDPQTFDLEFEYRITPRVDEGKTVLRCDRTFLEPADAPSVDEFTYVLNPLCLDLDMNRRVDEDDAVAWCDSPVDVNRDGNVDLADLATLLEHVQ